MPLLGLSAQAVVFLRLRHLVRKTSPDSMTMESVNRSEQLSENLLLLFFPADRHRSRASYLLDKWIIISESGPRPGRDIAELNKFPIYRIHSLGAAGELK